MVGWCACPRYPHVGPCYGPRPSAGLEQAWTEYKAAWAKSISPQATSHDLDPDAKRRALRAFRAGWWAAIRGPHVGPCYGPRDVDPAYLERLRIALSHVQPMSDEVAAAFAEGPEVSGGADAEPEDDVGPNEDSPP